MRWARRSIAFIVAVEMLVMIEAERIELTVGVEFRRVRKKRGIADGDL